MEKGLSLLMDLYELTMAQAYFTHRKNALATFDLYVRQLPANRSYLVACGLEDILEYLKDLRFSRGDLDYLGRQNIFSRHFLKFLKNFKFRGDVWAMPEGTVFFANEPVIRVTASIIEAQIIESFLLNTVNLQAMIASKACRVAVAAGSRGVYDFSLRRTHGSDAGIKVGRSAYIAGFKGTSCVLSGKLYGIPVVGTMAHSFIMSFKKEIAGFLAYARDFPARSTLLVDTYDTKIGIDNAIKVGLHLQRKGHRLQGIRLDSGDIACLSRLARRRLDEAGLGYVKIFASGNLDEFKISRLLEKKAAVDNFGVGTNMGTSIDAPCLDAVYKISEVTDEEGRFLPTMKLSRGKVTYPGRKQVFRVQDRAGRFRRDVLGLEGEKISGRPLLIKVIDRGRLIYKTPALSKIQSFLKEGTSRFPEGLLDIRAKYKYPVLVSPGLKRLRRNLTFRLKRRQ
jgi:nicotinate phosphoribosyltransferase